MELLSSTPFLGLLGAVGLAMATYLAKRYVIPFLSVGKRREYAQYIATIAQDIIDDLRARYPNNEWLKHLDEAVDELIDICGIADEIAQRAIAAAAARRR